jgi:hypothetical protein
LNPDTDGDGLIDGFEDANGDGVHDSLLNETRADRPDTDFDLLDDNEEPAYSTDPNDRDTDNDWLPDGWEVHRFGTNATLYDTDGEGLNDGLEVARYGTNALLPDTDSDGLTDWVEIMVYRTNPFLADTDGEGLEDYEEIHTYGTNPKNPDTDYDGVSDYDEVIAGTNPLNAPPFARFGLDRQVYRNEDVQLDGTQSFDVDGTVESYFWNFVGPISLTITNPWDPMIRFSQLGEYNVTLTVTDDDGESGTSMVTFTVVNQPPIADAGLDQSVFSGFSVDFQATPESSDPDGSIVTYVWDFMDGTFGFGPSTTHVFGLPGTYYVTLTVVDNDGGRDTDTVVITAEEPRPPDLVIPSEDIDFVTDGTDVILSLTIHNDGDLDADSLSFELSDDATGWTALWSEASGIPAGSSLDFDIVLPPEPIGSHNIRIEVDQDQVVDESDEGNNVVYISVPDADEDSLSDLGESIIGTNPNDSDSDGDGLKDGPHSIWSTSDWVTEQDAFVDTDGDGLINALDDDSDNDGYTDGIDIDPLHDLLVKLQINQLDIRDNIDFDIVWKPYTVRVPYVTCTWKSSYGIPYLSCSTRYTSVTVYYPETVLDKLAEPYFRVRMSDQWDSDNWMHSEVPVAEDVQGYSSSTPPLFVANVPDDQPIVGAEVEAWDVDVALNDQLDIGGVDAFTDYSYTAVFNLEQAVQSQPGVYTKTIIDSGSYDGSSWWDDDDATIEYTMYMDYELSYQEQMTLAEKFSPQFYFDLLEVYRPREILAFLENAVLKNSTGGDVTFDPLTDDLADFAGSGHYLDLDNTYYTQDSTGHDLKIYAHVFTAYKDYVVIQYFFLYLYNDWVNNHEGDWEMIQLILPPIGSNDADDLVPLAAGYSWHNHIKKSLWTVGPLLKDSTNHPVVFVEEGSHGSQFSPLGISAKADMTQYSIELLNNQGWLKFDGPWGIPGGTGSSGSPGPVFRSGWILDVPHLMATYDGYSGYMWTDPIFWFRYVTMLI